MERRGFLGAVVAAGAAIVTGCSSDPEASPSNTAAPTTAAPSTTTSTTTTTTVPTTTVPTTTVATAAPVVEPAGLVLPAPPTSDTWWLNNHFAPVDGEFESTDLVVRGTIPEALNGTWVRNGPNPPNGESIHWFDGDGMVHGLRLRGGEADWYGRKYLQTPFTAPDADPAALAVPGREITRSNVSFVQHGGRLLSLGEVGFPYEVDPADLSTVGPYDFDGALQTAMTAHPKIDPATGEMYFFGYDFREPYLTYHVADASGLLTRSVPIGLANAPMMHDFAITTESVIFMDLGIRFDLAAGISFPFLFDRDFPCRIGVMPRDSTTDAVRWFDVDSSFVFHTVNAHQSGQIVTLDAIRYPELWTESPTEEFSPAVPYRYEIDLKSGSVTEGPLDDRWVEFPMIDRDRMTGRQHSISWTADIGPTTEAPRASTIVQHRADGSSDSAASYMLPDNDVAGEPMFVADPDGSAEGDGWIFLAVYRSESHRSDVVILDARDVAGGPVASIELPVRVPEGFHAAWSPA